MQKTESFQNLSTWKYYKRKDEIYNMDSIFGHKLKEARTSRNLKQTEVAARLNCAPTSLTNWETGKVNPPLEQLEKMCIIYNISPLDLLPRRPGMADIIEIANFGYAARTYDEHIALNFCGELLQGGDNDLTGDEAELLQIFRSTDKSTKEVILKMMRGL